MSDISVWAHFHEDEEYYDFVQLKIQINVLTKISIFYDINVSCIFEIKPIFHGIMPFEQ